MNEFYVYIYLENDMPYYIGMGQGKRFMRWHNFCDVPCDWDNIWIIRNLTQQEAWNLEEALIAAIGRMCVDTGPLTNLAKGGPSSKTGWKHSEEAKARISIKLKGRKKSEKHKQNMKKPNSKAHNEKIRQANLGRKDDGRHLKIAKAMAKKRWFTNGIKAKFCEPELVPEGFVPGRKL